MHLACACISAVSEKIGCSADWRAQEDEDSDEEQWAQAQAMARQVREVEARAKATQTTIDPSNMTSAQLQNFQGAQGELSGALSRLLVTIEKYPDLKANQNFLELQAELAGTENRIGVARDNFNSEAKNYNTTIKKFPTNIIAGLFNFEAKPYFEADAGSKNAPKVEF